MWDIVVTSTATSSMFDACNENNFMIPSVHRLCVSQPACKCLCSFHACDRDLFPSPHKSAVIRALNLSNKLLAPHCRNHRHPTSRPLEARLRIVSFVPFYIQYSAMFTSVWMAICYTVNAPLGTLRVAIVGAGLALH